MLSTYAPESDTILTSVSGTRERLLLTAIRLFSEHGFHGVSLRTINEQSGAKNGSAVQYHFGSKFGLITAVVEFIAGEMFPESYTRLQDLERDSATRKLAVREIVEACFGPPLAYSLKPGLGIQAARVMPLVVQDSDPKIRQLFVQVMGELIDRLHALLVVVLPGKPAQVLRLQIGFALVNLLHLVTDLHVLYGVDSAVTDQDVLVRVYDFFLDYIASGLASSRLGDGAFRDELVRLAA